MKWTDHSCNKIIRMYVIYLTTHLTNLLVTWSRSVARSGSLFISCSETHQDIDMVFYMKRNAHCKWTTEYWNTQGTVTCYYVLRCLQGNAPLYLADHVVTMASVGRRSGLRSVDITLEVPRTWLSFDDRAFCVAGPRTWNSLPIYVRFAQSMNPFWKLLDTFLFQRAYSWLVFVF